MKASEIYLKVAERVAEEDTFSCIAIGVLGSYSRERYERLFKPENLKDDYSWLDGQFETRKEQHNWRVLALLFMHQIAKDEESK